MDKEIFVIYIWNATRIACAVSFVCLIIHCYKFFRSPTKQSMATRNLTLYCSFLILIYLTVFIDPRFNEARRREPDHKTVCVFVVIMQYLLATSVFYKFIIALDLCWSFRNIALYLQPHSGSQEKTFIIYCLSGIGIPLLYMALRLTLFYNENDKVLSCMATHYELDAIRILRLIPIFGAFWYIRSASINKSELWTRFSLHIRLLFLLGGFSALLSVAYLFSYVLITKDGSSNHYAVMRIYYMIQLIGMILEGFVITICFTFRIDTFHSNIIR